MSDKLTQDEIYTLFGGTLPAAACGLIQNIPSGMSINDARQQLTGMAALWKSLQISLIQKGMLHPFSAQGRTVLLMYDPLCVVESEKMAGEMVMLLNMGHEKFLQDMPS